MEITDCKRGFKTPEDFKKGLGDDDIFKGSCNGCKHFHYQDGLLICDYDVQTSETSDQ